jgi:hypothetical protein
MSTDSLTCPLYMYASHTAGALFVLNSTILIKVMRIDGAQYGLVFTSETHHHEYGSQNN